MSATAAADGIGPDRSAHEVGVMRVMQLRPVAGAVLVWALCGHAPGALAQAAAPACGLAGSWVLNVGLSRGPDEPVDKEGDGRPGPPGGGMGGAPGSGGGGTSVGMPGMGMGRGGGMDRDRMKRLQRIVQAEIEPAPRLAILCDARQVTVTAGEDRPEVLVLDGKKHLKLTGEGEIYTTTVWQEGRVVSERRYDEGIKATRRFAIETDKDGVTRLVVVLKIDGIRGAASDRDREGRRRNGELRRVYDAVPPA
jgi:hypothetical protein